jgi:hypothetical protein
VDKREFAIAHRKYTFWDEWLFYVAAFILLTLHLEFGWSPWPFILVVIHGIICTAVSYKRQWEMEKDLD